VLKTTSQLLSFHKTIEKKQAALYSTLAKKYPQYAEVFDKQEKDSLRQMDMAQRAYREEVTDAFEVGFLADPLDPEKYRLSDLILPEIKS